MNFLYNVWQSFKRNIVFHILTLVMLVVLFYIGTNVVGYKADTDNFFEHCGYNKDFANDVVVSINQNEFDNNEDYDKFLTSNKLNELGCSAVFDIVEDYLSGNMITPHVAQALLLKKADGWFSQNYVGDGLSKPYEIMFDKSWAHKYEIGKEYELTKETNDTTNQSGNSEKIKVKVVGYFNEYTIDISFAEFYGCFTQNKNGFLICGIPQEGITPCLIMNEQDYEKNADLLVNIENDKCSLKQMYDLEHQTFVSNVSSRIIRIVLVYLILIATIISFNFYKYDSTKKYNQIKKIVGENKVSNICTEIIINLIVFVLAVAIVSIIGVIDPAIFGEVFPNIGFAICIGVAGVTYFGILAVSLFKVNNYLNK